MTTEVPGNVRLNDELGPNAQDDARDPHRGGSSYEASMLRNLLARIHRDGGHYVEKHGLDKALAGADAQVVRWLAMQDELAAAPVAIMDTREALSLCAPTEDDFTALYALQGHRVALVDLGPNVLANRHFAAGRVWARLLKPKPGPPQSVRLSDQLGRAA